MYDPIDLPLQIPPLAGARCNAPPIPSGRATGAGEEVSPLASSPATPAFLPVASMEAVLAERARQIHHFGHTPEADTALPLKQLPREAARFVNMAIEDCQFQAGDWRKAARNHLVRAGAMILAAMDRIEAEPVEEDPL